MTLAEGDVVPEKTFLDVPYCADPEKVDTPYAFVGVPFGPPYRVSELTVAADAADEVRQESHRRSYAANWTHHDFDFGDVLFPDGQPTVTDCGSVPHDFRDPDGIWDTAAAFFTKLVNRGVVPLVVGGLDSVPPTVGAAFVEEAVNVLQIDAHLDFRDELHGVTRGLSSPMRRMREMPWVQEIVQVGLRAAGSAEPQDVHDALESGNRLITAWELHELGAQSVLDSLTAPGRWIITVDCDGLDPAIAPGVGAREPGGLSFVEIRTLVAGLARQNKIAAAVFTEYQPARDIQRLTAQTIVRLLANVIGAQRAPLKDRAFRAG